MVGKMMGALQDLRLRFATTEQRRWLRSSPVVLSVAFALLAMANGLGLTAPLDAARSHLIDWTAASPIRLLSHPVSGFGSWPVTVVIAAVLGWRWSRVVGKTAALTTLAAIVLSLVIEAALRLEPGGVHLADWRQLLFDQADADTFRSSFPSGHMGRMTILVGGALPMIPQRYRIATAAIVLTATVINRLQFSGHTVSDLFGGALFGVAMLSVSRALLVQFTAWQSKRADA